MTDDEPKGPPDAVTGSGEQKPPPTSAQMRKHEPTVLGVGAMRAREPTVLGVAPPANAAASPPTPAAPSASTREETILGLGDTASPPVPPEPAKPSEPKLAPLPPVRAPAEVTPRKTRDDASISVEPAGVPPAGGAWKVLLSLLIAGGGVAAYLERDRIASELSPPSTTTPPAPEPPDAAAAPLPVPSVDAEVENVAATPDLSGLDASAMDAGHDAGNHTGTKDAVTRKDGGAPLDLHAKDPHARGTTTAHPPAPRP
jgi:hypothetical protein